MNEGIAQPYAAAEKNQTMRPATTNTPSQATRRALTIMMGVALVLTIGSFSRLIWCVNVCSRELTASRREVRRIERLRNVMAELDESTSAPVLLAVTTGDPKWERRYLENERVADRELAALDDLCVEVGDSWMNKDFAASHVSRLRMEHEALGLLRSGRQGEAVAMLQSAEYLREREVEAKGLRSWLYDVEKRATNRLEDRTQRARVAQFTAVGTAAVVSAIWMIVPLMARRRNAVNPRSTDRMDSSGSTLRDLPSDQQVRPGPEVSDPVWESDEADESPWEDLAHSVAR